MTEDDGRLDKAFTLRVSSRLYEALMRRARQDHRKLADYARLVLDRHVEDDERQPRARREEDA